MNAAATAAEPILVTNGLTKNFGGLCATNQVSFTLQRGAKEAIIGPNGAGKSTFFALISGRHLPDAGTVTFDNADVTGLPPHEIARRGMSRAFQISSIFARLTVLENVRSAVQVRRGCAFHFFSDARRVELERAEEILLLCRLADRRFALAGALSQGDKKKLELALALAGEPHLLLLDEPTAGMSLEETRDTMALVDDLNETHGLTILFTEHDMSVVFNHAQRVSLLHRGKMILSGSPAEIRANAEVQSIYLGGQA